MHNTDSSFYSAKNHFILIRTQNSLPYQSTHAYNWTRTTKEILLHFNHWSLLQHQPKWFYEHSWLAMHFIKQLIFSSLFFPDWDGILNALTLLLVPVRVIKAGFSPGRFKALAQFTVFAVCHTFPWQPEKYLCLTVSEDNFVFPLGNYNHYSRARMTCF